jgi:hypothetical protein
MIKLTYSHFLVSQLNHSVDNTRFLNGTKTQPQP